MSLFGAKVGINAANNAWLYPSDMGKAEFTMTMFFFGCQLKLAIICLDVTKHEDFEFV
jgi:hypothetical protein